MKVSPFSSLSKGGYSIRVYVGLDRGADSDHGTSNITLSAESLSLEGIFFAGLEGTVLLGD